MKRRWKFITTITVVVAVLSLFLTWNFDKRLRIAQSQNPLWNEGIVPIDSALTHALREEGLSFQTGRGAEADPDGICFGDFASDEYWVVQYDPVSHEVHAYAWIIAINWIAHVAAERRFARIRGILREHLQL
jgi:hypothetical protein